MYYSQPSFKQDLLATASNNGRPTSNQLLDKHFASASQGSRRSQNQSSLPSSSNHAKTNGEGGQPSTDQEKDISGMLNNFSKALGKFINHSLYGLY